MQIQPWSSAVEVLRSTVPCMQSHAESALPWRTLRWGVSKKLRECCPGTGAFTGDPPDQGFKVLHPFGAPLTAVWKIMDDLAE